MWGRGRVRGIVLINRSALHFFYKVSYSIISQQVHTLNSNRASSLFIIMCILYVATFILNINIYNGIVQVFMYVYIA